MSPGPVGDINGRDCRKFWGLKLCTADRCVPAAHADRSWWSLPGQFCGEGRIAGQVRCPLMQSHLFTKNIVSKLLQSALRHNKCSQFYFSKPLPSVLVQAMLVLGFHFSVSQAFTLPVNGEKNQTHISFPFSASQRQ